jgi:hypothetical protein
MNQTIIIISHDNALKIKIYIPIFWILLFK